MTRAGQTLSVLHIKISGGGSRNFIHNSHPGEDASNPRQLEAKIKNRSEKDFIFYFIFILFLADTLSN